MKNAIGAIIILFIVYLHLLVTPPRILRGDYYKNPSRSKKTCNYESTCNTDYSDYLQYKDHCNATDGKTEDECTGICMTYTLTDTSSDERIYTGKRCIEYCEDYCVEIKDGVESCFSCCYDNKCN